MIERLKRFSDLENLLKVLKYALDNSIGLGTNLPVLTKFYIEHLLHKTEYSKKEFMSAYMRLYRFFKCLGDLGYVEIKNVDGLIWIKPNDRAVDLILYARKTQTPRGSRKIMETAKRLDEHKYTARVYVSRKCVLDRSDYEYLYDLFQEYLEKTNRKILVFKNPDGEIVIKRYSHRFQKRYLRRLKEKFRKIFDNASKRFQSGVFLTLTMDPKSYSSILEGVRLRSEAWNRFMSFLAKRLGFRPRYVSVLEFQDSGNPHLHVVVFGVSRIGDHYELTSYLVGHGFGQIHYEYKIVNKHGKWVWESSSPSLRRDVVDYLEKYLEKSFGVEDAAASADNVDSYKVTLYWASDARFFTYSRTLYTEVKLPREYGWVFIGSYNVFEAPDWLWDYVEDLIHVLGPPPWV